MDILNKIQLKQKDFYNNKPVTIVFLGDSVTQGCFECYFDSQDKLDTVYEPDSAFSTVLLSMLRKLYPKVQFNVINSGLSGDSAPNGLNRLERDVFSFSPDLVVVAFALNDANRGKEGLQDYGKAIDDILSMLESKGIESIILTPNAMNTEISYSLTDKRSQDLARHFAEMQNTGVLKTYVDEEKRIAKKHGVKVCDVYSTWEKLIKGGVKVTELLANKLNHPIREMHYFTAIKLLETMFE